jgi:hypothetical protein
MKYLLGQHWQDKIETLRRLALNVKARNAAARFTPELLSEAQRERVEDATRFEQYRGRILKQNGSKKMVTNA